MTPALLVVLTLAAGPSEVIFPAQRIPLRFSHRQHLAKHIDCDFCHDRASTSHSAADNLIPGEDVCATCHVIVRKESDRRPKTATPCASCHPEGTDARVAMPPPHLRFDHAAHVGRGVACTRCHADVARTDLATRAQLPRMELCLGCHDSGRGRLHAASRCATCHLAREGGVLETRFDSGVLVPSGVLRGDAHGLDFRQNHAAVARADERYCENCHRQDFCRSCHDGVVKPFDFHGGDYVSRHGVDARRNVPDCSACHRAQSFCLACHERLGVVDARTRGDTPLTPFSGRTFHPAGWSAPQAAGVPVHHAWQAQKNLKQCVACHRQETCLDCHATAAGNVFGQQNVNPHPIGWRGSSRCTALAERNARVCLRCHAAGDPLLSCR
jgi:Cytochrome c7 and related cytochrome c